MKYLSLTIPEYGQIQTPDNIPTGKNVPSNAIQVFMGILVLAVIVGALIYTIYGGILWITSGGDKGKLDKARHTIMYAIIGLIIMVFAFLIIRVVGEALGICTIQNFGVPNATCP